MAHSPPGVNLTIPTGRRLIAEYMHQSRNVPVVAIRREFSIPGLIAVRSAARPKVSWVALFTRAYALAARRHAPLRRAWTTFPWARLYEHPVSCAAVLVEREWQGEEVVLGAKVHEPELMGLADIDRFIRKFQTAPVRSVSTFRQLLRVARLPGLLRRFVLWRLFHWSGYRRCKRFGTFVVSSLGSFGCEQTALRLPLTAYLTFGPIARDGRVAVGLTFDHRVLDARTAARALEDVERILNTVLVAELRALTPDARPADQPAPAPRAVPAG
jgi:hypothetical protein